MTKQKPRYYISDFSSSPYNISQMMIDLIEKSDEYRVTNLPKDMSPSFVGTALYSYGDVLLFEIALVIHGDSIKSFANQYQINYRKVLRIVNQFDRGHIHSKTKTMHKGDAFTIRQMLNYINDTLPYLRTTLY